jgi:NitT/TauT family transport system substrate-binding protein
MQRILDRRQVLTEAMLAGLVTLAGTPHALAADGPLETTAVRLGKVKGICIAPQYVAEELLRLEGFTEIRYVEAEAGYGQSEKIAQGEIDFSLNFAAPLIVAIDAGSPIKILAGVHPGCFELFANETVHHIIDLKGRTVGIQGLGSTPHLFLTGMAAYVGLDPAKDIRWVASPSIRPKELFIEGKVDAFLGFPPEPQELRDRGIGHVVVNSAIDHPWAQYFCCMLAGNADFIRSNPAATKRVVRAILKAADLCVSDPQRVARQIVDAGFASRYDYALQAMRDVPYAKWREYDPEDTLRFYALRLHEAAMIATSPQDIIARGVDWHFLDKVKHELKA